jgi:PPK2 family polyphosphate:nucleotide phosphotransferase
MSYDKALAAMEVTPGKKIKLRNYPTDFKKKDKGLTKEEAAQRMEEGMEHFKQMQDMLYASKSHSVLIVIQAMDAAGKDSAVKHVMSGLNPISVKVHAYKAPNDEERAHDYLWRHNLDLPARGEIGIFVRSHYENVLACKVHPEFVLGENIPHIQDVKVIDKKFWEMRYRQINDWERYLTENGTTIIKVFLFNSKDEQKIQFMERIDDPEKNWKFSLSDLKERALWDKYMEAYEDMFNHTSTEWAPWHIIPANDRWFSRIALGSIIYRRFKTLKLKYPVVSEEQKKRLQDAKKALLAEKD